jgi:hypothetical protein
VGGEKEDDVKLSDPNNLESLSERYRGPRALEALEGLLEKVTPK